MNDSNLNIRPKEKNEGKKIILFAILFLVLAGASYFISKSKGTNVGKVNLDLYVMSQCPYGTQAEGIVLGAMDGFEDYVNFNVEYIATLETDGTISSLHGEAEVEGDIHQLCVKKNYPDKFWKYLECQNKNRADLKSSFESCSKEVGADYQTIKTCAEGEQGHELLTASLNKAESLKVSGSPTFYLNGKKYSGARTEVALQRAMCEATDNKAKKCAELPQDKEFTAYIIQDSRCTADICKTDRLETQLKTTFPKIKYEKIDYTTKEGKEFFDKYKLKYLPAALLTKDAEKTENFSQVEKYLTKTDDLYNLAIGASHDPTKEICYNNTDDTGNGLIDCNDPDCDGFLECRKEKISRLDLFVMSMCPYGTRAMDAMKEVLNNFDDNLDFHINYIANENPDGTFKSLHGQPEVDEDIRELCAMKYYPNNYMNYVWCRNKNIKGDWQECVTDFPAIKPCSEANEGKKLLSQNIKLANDLGIGASPTWMVNNKYKFNGIDAETVKTNFCKYNDMAACDNTLSGQSAGGGSAPAGSCN